MKNKVLEFLNKQYPEDSVLKMLDDEIYSGDWIHEDWQDDGYDDEYDWYINHSNGEAESSVLNQIINHVFSGLSIDFTSYKKETGEEIYQTIIDIYECLDK